MTGVLMGAVKLWEEEMKLKWCRPIVFSYTACMKILSDHKRVKEAIENSGAAVGEARRGGADQVGSRHRGRWDAKGVLTQAKTLLAQKEKFKKGFKFDHVKDSCSSVTSCDLDLESK
ncbi:Uncharacterized protein Fot_48559 [Forsythia ovata]|uniref:Uncharacterized protein n=1 Tax=Forsythia ovata TaxID=205694 RepID=A0ABD1QB45_9LAMI